MDFKAQNLGPFANYAPGSRRYTRCTTTAIHSTPYYQSATPLFLSSSSCPHIFNKVSSLMSLVLMLTPQCTSSWLLLCNHFTENVLIKFTNIYFIIKQMHNFQFFYSVAKLQTAGYNLLLKDFSFHFHFFASF